MKLSNGTNVNIDLASSGEPQIVIKSGNGSNFRYSFDEAAHYLLLLLADLPSGTEGKKVSKLYAEYSRMVEDWKLHEFGS